jgi:PAS domain-containing protein
VCNAPIAVVNLIDEKRQFFKAEIGLGVREAPVDISICAHGLLQPGLFVVPDTTKDERFVCNPLVTGEPHLRFYAGALLETPEGHPIGTVCVLDFHPRPDGGTPEQGETLQALARAVMAHLELRRANRELAERQREVEAVTDTMPQIVWSNRPDGYDAIWDWEIESGKVLWNRAIQRQFEHEVARRLLSGGRTKSIQTTASGWWRVSSL